MTEAEWLACAEPGAMLDVIHPSASERKLRLLGCAACRRVWDAIEDDRCRNAVIAAERFAEGLLPADAFAEVVNAVGDAYCETGARYTEAGWAAALAACLVTVDRLTPDPDVTPSYLLDVLQHTAAAAQCHSESAVQADLFRDVFGNPFRPVTFSPPWRTGTAVVLASQIYEARDFAALPILADALQDAGCDRAEILNHCRGPGPHVRGCWVVDWVLGKG